MAIKRYLAMTAAEFEGNDVLPPHIGWMACHFSSYGTGLSNLPTSLPPESLLILNDRTPLRGHSPDRIAKQLLECAAALECCGLLLDFQQSKSAETAALAKFLLDALPFPVAVSGLYAEELNCPIFLPPVPHHIPLQEYLSPWQRREIWLELALDGEILTLEESGCSIVSLYAGAETEESHHDKALHCHYQISALEDRVLFSLCRTPEDLEALLEEAETLGVSTAVGLYQEFYPREHALF